MILDLKVIKEIDGYSAKIESLDGVETWAENEEAAINKIVEILIFYFNIADPNEIKIERAARGKSFSRYKIIFGRTSERVFD